ncbi:MAG: tetratricopeptide repeat protein, partial [Chloroflexi bacterium]|nr:tetratricopeptide repeat protein [Chloroflexota bacterium]
MANSNSETPSPEAGSFSAANGDQLPGDKIAGDKAGRDLFKDITLGDIHSSPISLAGDAAAGNIYKVAGDLIIQPTPPVPLRVNPAEAQALLDAMPADRPVQPGDLPPGSRMPLARNPLFTGREANLQRLARTIKAGRTVATHQAAAITGLGGVGKTQLASEFVYRYGRYFAGGAYWLNFAEPDSVPAEVAACGLAMGLGSGFERLDLAGQVALVQRVWQEPLPRLLVFDNCEDEALLTRWRPVSGGCRVLVTSRRGRWEPVLGIVVLPLGALSRPESVALLQRLVSNLIGPRAGAIAAELGDFPLALHLAGSFLAYYSQVISPMAYLVQLRSKALLTHPSLQGQASGHSPTGHERHVARTFALSFKQLNPAAETDRVALALLARAACFAPGVPIPRSLLTATLNPGAPAGRGLDAANLPSEDALARLTELGLLEEERAGALRLHRLLAVYVQGRLVEVMDEAARAVAEAVAQAAVAINQAGYPNLLLGWQDHLRHVANTAGQRGGEQGGRLWNALGYHLVMIADYAGAQAAFEWALAIDEAVFGSDHPVVARDVNNLGVALKEWGNYAGAQAAFERALAIDEAAFGSHHPEVATDVNNLGGALKAQGDYAGARAAYERALAIDEATFGPHHPKVATGVNNLAGVLKAQGDYAGARAAYERALQIDEAVYGRDHPYVAIRINNLGAVLEAQGNYAEAQAAYESALAIDERTLGPDHPNVARDVNNLGLVLQSQADYPRAQAAFERALAIFEKKLGSTHPYLATLYSNLGRVFWAQRNYAEARTAYERALAI